MIVFLCMGITTKTIKGQGYLYHWICKDGKKQEVYCGVASNPKSEKIAISKELVLLKTQRDELNKTIASMKIKLNKIKVGK